MQRLFPGGSGNDVQNRGVGGRTETSSSVERTIRVREVQGSIPWSPTERKIRF